MAKVNLISQEVIMGIMIPIMKEKGVVYRKFKKVWAKEALGGEEITSVTSDGTETVNLASPGDFIVKNLTQAGEMYIVKADTFQQRYQFDKNVEDGFAQYHPRGKVIAIEMNEDVLTSQNLRKEFQFIAPWSESVVVKQNDFLVSPIDYSQVYRIARQEFFETYELSPDENRQLG